MGEAGRGRGGEVLFSLNFKVEELARRGDVLTGWLKYDLTL